MSELEKAKLEIESLNSRLNVKQNEIDKIDEFHYDEVQTLHKDMQDLNTKHKVHIDGIIEKHQRLVDCLRRDNQKLYAQIQKLRNKGD